MIKADRKLPIYSPIMLNPELVDKSMQDVKKNHRIADFSLINQNGEEFTSRDLEGKYYVTDFFFTTCPTICPDMSSQLMRVQEAYSDVSDFMIVSHSVTPKIDSPSVLKAYAKLYDANPKQSSVQEENATVFSSPHRVMAQRILGSCVKSLKLPN